MSSSDPYGLQAAFDSRKYSDMRLICEGTEFNVHKLVVSMQSPVLGAAIDGNFKEGHSNTITIQEFDVDTVAYLVQFFYTKDYKICEESSSNSEHHPLYSAASTASSTAGILVRHVRVNKIADYYNVPVLMALANAKVELVLAQDWTADGFMDVVKEVTEGLADERLHRIFVRATADHIDECLEPLSASPGIMNQFAIQVLEGTNTALKSALEWKEKFLLLDASFAICVKRVNQGHCSTIGCKKYRPSIIESKGGHDTTEVSCSTCGYVQD